MSYTKNTWVDQDVERPKTYEVTNNQDGSITLTDSFGLVTELGTPVNAANMNHIEDGIANSADIDLSNLSNDGEKHFLNKTQITNCILEAPNGVVTHSSNSFTVKAGLKVLIPNGRNADGTLKNIEYTLENDTNWTLLATNASYLDFIDTSGNIILARTEAIYFQNSFPTGIDSLLNRYLYKLDENKWYRCAFSTQDWNEVFLCPVCLHCQDGDNLSFIDIYYTTDLLKRSDKYEISGWGMPSGRYINLTLGASGTRYIAPANGWFYISKTSGAANQYLTMGGNGVYTRANVATSGHIAVEYVPCKKGGDIIVNYNLSGTTNTFRFVYAVGSESEAS